MAEAVCLGGGNGGNGSIGADCPYLSDAEAREVLGGQADASVSSGLFDATIGLIADKRVLADADDCLVFDGQRAYLVRIAVHQGGDAAQVFAQERQSAQPVTVDQGGGLSTTRSGYDGGSVSGLGDEAFCTSVSPAFMGGVLVHQGDRDVYVTVGAQPDPQAPIDLTPTEGDNEPVSPSLCQIAQDVARAVLD